MKEECPALSQIANRVSEYYKDGGMQVELAIERAARDFKRFINLDRQLGPVYIINDCKEKYGITGKTTLRVALGIISGTHGGNVTASQKRSKIKPKVESRPKQLELF